MDLFPTGGRIDRRAEFEKTALPHTRALYGFAHRLSRRPEDASDLVQETFLRAYRTFDGFARGSNAKAWLFTILHSVFANRARKQRRTPPQVPVHEIEERLSDARVEPTTLAAESLPAQEVERALQELPETYRAAVLLVDVNELTYEDAATVLDCPVGTLRSRLYRGRRLLHDSLEAYARRLGLLRHV